MFALGPAAAHPFDEKRPDRYLDAASSGERRSRETLKESLKLFRPPAIGFVNFLGEVIWIGQTRRGYSQVSVNRFQPLRFWSCGASAAIRP